MVVVVVGVGGRTKEIESHTYIHVCACVCSDLLSKLSRSPPPQKLFDMQIFSFDIRVAVFSAHISRNANTLNRNIIQCSGFVCSIGGA